jgi:hypothetical protein
VGMDPPSVLTGHLWKTQARAVSKNRPGMVAQACNPSYSSSGDQKDRGSRPASASVRELGVLAHATTGDIQAETESQSEASPGESKRPCLKS